MFINRRYSKIYGFICLVMTVSLVTLQMYVDDSNVYNLIEHLQTGIFFMTRIPVGNIYIYSAFASLPDERGNLNSVTINVWDGTQNKKFDCCLFNKNNKNDVLRAKAFIKNDFGYSTLIARQYHCPLRRSLQNITDLGLVERKNPCSNSMPLVPLIFPKRETKKMAICAKIAYGKMSPQRLIEWFEYQRLMGVDKIVTMVQYLNDDAYKVLLYYKKLNLLEIDAFPSPLPGKVPGFPDRGFEENRLTLPQCSHDKQVGVYHCQEKLQGYDFVGVVDYDEFIIHDDHITYKDIFEIELLPRYPDAAGFTLNVSFFILDWGATGMGELFLTRYVDRTEPRYECYKNIYIPKRVKEVTTHTFDAKPAFKRYVLSKHNVVMNHYRECPKVPQWKNCLKEPRTTDLKMFHFKQQLSERVRNVKKDLGMQT